MTNKKRRMSNFFINAFYHSKFQDQLFVVKASGDIIEDDKALESLIQNIKELSNHGINILLIYGGGKATDAELKARGIDIKKNDGRRITDDATIAVMQDVIGGRLSLKVGAAIAKHRVEGLSFNAIPHNWLEAHFRPKKPVDYGHVGDIHKTSKRDIMRTFKATNFVACPCLVFSEAGDILNINADTIATDLAIGAEAGKLVFMSNVDGVIIDKETAFMITDKDIPKLIKQGIVTDGMRVKMETCLKALKAGVKRIHLINGLRKDSLYKEIFESIGPGTMIISEKERVPYNNEIAIHKALGQSKAKTQKKTA